MALLVVMVLMGIMLTAGFALVATVDTQSSASRQQRTRDSAFNLAESALNAQIFVLARDWPGSRLAPGAPPPSPYPVCSPATGTTRCPDNAALIQGGSADLAAAGWQTRVYDNGAASAPNFYSDSIVTGQPAYDANGDNKVWVRAQGTVEGRARTLVALVGTEPKSESIPHAALIAGRFSVGNSAPNKEFIRSNGAMVAVRCTGPSDAVCLGADLSPPVNTAGKLYQNLANWVTGTTPTHSYPPTKTALSPDALAGQRARAIVDGTFYSGCPSAAQLTGKVVYVVSGNCSYTGNDQFNSAQSPGILIIEQGSITFGGTTRFKGVVYVVNTNNATSTVFKTQGNAGVDGGILIDGPGQAEIGSSSEPHLKFDPNAFAAIESYGSAGVIQNTFRELRAG